MANKSMNTRKITLSNSISYGIGANNRWQILQRSGNPQLQDLLIEYLIAENLDAEDSPANVTTKFIGDGHGKYGISVTLISKNRPFTHATVIDEDVLQQILSNPPSLVQAFREYFHIDSGILEYAFGHETAFLLSNDPYSKIARVSAGYRFRKNSISIRIMDYAPERGGMFGLLKLIWDLLPVESRKRIFAIYPVKADANTRVLLLSSRTFSHASVALKSATNFNIASHYNHILKMRYQSIFDFLRSLWPL